LTIPARWVQSRDRHRQWEKEEKDMLGKLNQLMGLYSQRSRVDALRKAADEVGLRIESTLTMNGETLYRFIRVRDEAQLALGQGPGLRAAEGALSAFRFGFEEGKRSHD